MEGRICDQEARAAIIDSKQAEVSTEVDNLVAIVNEIVTLVSSQARGGGVAGAGAAVAAGDTQATVQALQDELAMLRRDFTAEIKSLKMSSSGKGPFRIGIHEFDGYASCERFCRLNGLDKQFHYDFLLGPHAFLASLANTTLTREEYVDTAILTTKTSLTPNQLRGAASFKCTYPQIFAGSAKQDVTAAAGIAKFTNIKTYNEWDRGDEESGIRNYIKMSVLELHTQMNTLVATTFGGPENAPLTAFLNNLYTLTVTALNELVDNLTELFVHLCFLSYGNVVCTPAQIKECWEFCLVTLQVWCQETA